MKFEEDGNYITIPNRNNSLVYFLLQDGDVVYVGKSSIGIARPYFNLWELKKILNKLNIVPFNDEYTGSVYITVDEYHKVEQYIKGRLENEISQT